MRKHPRILAVCLGLVLMLAALSPTRAAELRGFGTIHASRMPQGQGMTFACDSPEHAILLIHKLARDMAASATVPSHWTNVPLAGQAVPVLVRPGLSITLE